MGYIEFRLHGGYYPGPKEKAEIIDSGSLPKVGDVDENQIKDYKRVITRVYIVNLDPEQPRDEVYNYYIYFVIFLHFLLSFLQNIHPP